MEVMKVMKAKKTLIVAAAVAVVAVLGAFEFAGQTQPSAVVNATLLVSPAEAATSDELLVAGPLGEKTMGDPNAPNTVIEYASLTCPHCQRFREDTFDAFKKKYIDTGEVYFIFREFPLNPLDTAAIMLTNCIPEERFFPLVDLLYEQQANWAYVDKPAEALLNIVRQAGFTQESFTACLKDQKVLDGVDWVRSRASDKFGVDSTPTFFFNGQKMSGEITLDQIDGILAK
jgi:protein-disulfide isomerase